MAARKKARPATTGANWSRNRSTSRPPSSARTDQGAPAPAPTEPEVPDEELILLEDLPDGMSDGLGVSDLLDGGGRIGEEHDSTLAAGDPDANVSETGSGEEAVGGSASTPDQNDVDAIGRALGVSYAASEPLHTTEKIERRDADRWELNPASSEDFAERQKLQGTVVIRRRGRR